MRETLLAVGVALMALGSLVPQIGAGLTDDALRLATAYERWSMRFRTRAFACTADATDVTLLLRALPVLAAWMWTRPVASLSASVRLGLAGTAMGMAARTKNEGLIVAGLLPCLYVSLVFRRSGFATAHRTASDIMVGLGCGTCNRPGPGSLRRCGPRSRGGPAPAEPPCVAPSCVAPPCFAPPCFAPPCFEPPCFEPPCFEPPCFEPPVL